MGQLLASSTPGPMRGAETAVTTERSRDCSDYSGGAENVVAIAETEQRL